MSRWHHHFHLVWATKCRQPLLTPQKEEVVFRIALEIAQRYGYELLAINGMPDHVHLLLSIGPKMDLSAFVKHIKGSSSALLNDMTDHNSRFRWQEGYYSATITPSHLPKVLAYIQNQKEHHAAGTTDAYWEETGETENGPVWKNPDAESG